MKQYKELLQHVLDNGVVRKDRTGTGTLSVFGYQNRYSLEDGFPLVTTKRVSFHDIKHELQWFLNGDTNIKYLNDNKVKIWDEWADENGDLGPVYGQKWRSFESQGTAIDQVNCVIHSIKEQPSSRRHIVSAWNPVDVPLHGMTFKEAIEDGYQALPPCHTMFQFYVHDDKLSCQLYQRSGDAFLGVPYNIASYALLTHYIARECGLGVGEFVHTFGDLHIYSNHLEQVHIQLERECKPLPTLVLGDTVAESTLLDYEHHGRLKGKVAI